MRSTAVASLIVIVATLGMLPAAAPGGSAEGRLGDIKLPPGFRIATYAEVPNARSMTLGERAWGRPVDLQVMPDGSLLVSDDMAGRIYRISYEEKTGASGRRPGKD